MSQNTDGHDEAMALQAELICPVCGRIRVGKTWMVALDPEEAEVLAESAMLCPCPVCRGDSRAARGALYSDSSLRAAAIDQITDQATLVEIARADRDTFVRRAALRKLTSQALLALPHPRRSRRLAADR